MDIQTIKQILVVGLAAEVIYRNIVRSHVRAYLGIEAH